MGLIFEGRTEQGDAHLNVHPLEGSSHLSYFSSSVLSSPKSFPSPGRGVLLPFIPPWLPAPSIRVLELRFVSCRRLGRFSEDSLSTTLCVSPESKDHTCSSYTQGLALLF